MQPTEFYLRWWLRQWGIDPAPLSVAEYVTIWKNELPPDLAEFLYAIRQADWS